MPTKSNCLHPRAFDLALTNDIKEGEIEVSEQQFKVAQFLRSYYKVMPPKINEEEQIKKQAKQQLAKIFCP